VCSCRPLQSLANSRLLRLTPRHSHGAHLERAWERCRRLLFGARSTLRCVAGRLAFPASSLALPPSRLAPDGGGPSRSSAPRRRPTGIAASGSSTHSSAPLRSTFPLPGPAHTGLLSWGRTGRPGFPGRLAPSPLRRLCTFLRRTVARSLPATSRGPSLSASGCHPEVSFRPRGFSPPRRFSPRYGAQACCILLPTLGFVPFHPTSRSQPRSPRRDHPSKDDPNRSWYSGHPEPWPPWRSSLLTPSRRHHC